MPIKDEQFDIVFNQGVMEHFRLAKMDAAEGVKEMMRVLKKDGTLVVLVPAYFSPLFLVYKIFKTLNLIEKYSPSSPSVLFQSQVMLFGGALAEVCFFTKQQVKESSENAYYEDGSRRYSVMPARCSSFMWCTTCACAVVCLFISGLLGIVNFFTGEGYC